MKYANTCCTELILYQSKYSWFLSDLLFIFIIMTIIFQRFMVNKGVWNTIDGSEAAIIWTTCNTK